MKLILLDDEDCVLDSWDSEDDEEFFCDFADMCPKRTYEAIIRRIGEMNKQRREENEVAWGHVDEGKQ